MVNKQLGKLTLCSLSVTLTKKITKIQKTAGSLQLMILEVPIAGELVPLLWDVVSNRSHDNYEEKQKHTKKGGSQPHYPPKSALTMISRLLTKPAS